MGFGAVVLVVVLFIISRALKQVGDAMKPGASLPTREPGSAPQTMAELLVEMRQQLETAQRREMAKRLPPSPTTHPAGSAQSVRIARAEQRGALKRLPVEVAERGGSIEVASREEMAIEIDRDDDAEAIVKRRIEAAEARNREWQESDHASFDRKIREAAPAPAMAKPRASLRQAMIWREVLGPPVALRPDDER